MKTVSILTPWTLVFIVGTIVISFIILVIVLFPLGISIQSNVMFATTAGISGVIMDVLLRRFGKVVLLAWAEPRLPFVVLWLSLMVLFVVIGPEGIARWR